MKSSNRVVSLPATLTVAVLCVAFLITGCSDLSTGRARASYPRFSLVGYPLDRPVDLLLRVSGPGMDPILRRVRGDDGALTLEVPAGRTRTFDFRAYDDIYSGRVTTAVAPDSEIRLRVPIFPGPVYVDSAGGQTGGDTGAQSTGQVVQIRDVDVAGSAVSDPENGLARRWPYDTEISGSLTNPSDAEFDAEGRLWVATGGDSLLEESARIYRTPTLSEYSHRTFEFAESALEIIPFGTPISALAIDKRRGRVYFSHGTTVSLMTTLGDLNTRFEVNLGGNDSTSVTHISDMTVDHEGNLHVLAVGTITTTRQGSTEDAVLLAKISGRDATVLMPPAAIPLITAIPTYTDTAMPPPVGAIAARGENLLLAVAAVPPAGREDYPPIALLDTNHRLLRTWGTKTESTRASPGEFWGPRRFLADRHGGPLLIIDQMDGTDMENGIGRIVSFTPGATNGWAVFRPDAVDPQQTGQFFNTTLGTGEPLVE